MKNAIKLKSLLMIALLAIFSVSCDNDDDKAVADETITGLAVKSPNLSILVQALTRVNLATTLQGSGSFTVFAPTNAAFEKLPAGTVETLVKPENKATLTAILTYHVVAGRLDAKEIARLIKEGNGKAELTTVQGGKLWLWMKDKTLWIKDEKGGMASVTIKDVYQSNGVIHVIDAVVLPKG